MIKRIFTGAFVTLIVFLTIWFSYIPGVVLSFTAVLCAFAVYEIFNATGIIKNEGVFTAAMLISIAVIFAEIPCYTEIIGIVFLAAVIAAIVLMIRKDKISLSNPFGAAFIALNVVLLFSSFSELSELKNGARYLAVSVVLSFLTDIFAYLVGRFFGKHKLLPSISPNKTIEGSAAGVLFTVLLLSASGFLLNKIVNFKINYFMLMVYTLLASLFGEFGDLAMSAVKRICKIKDFGNILPGHGGVLDRFDSVLFVVPFTYLFCVATGGFIY